jgi:hypothetical protein
MKNTTVTVYREHAERGWNTKNKKQKREQAYRDQTL